MFKKANIQPKMFIPDIPVLPQRFIELGAALIPPTLKVHLSIYRIDLTTEVLKAAYSMPPLGFALDDAEKVITISMARGPHFAASSLISASLLTMQHEYDASRIYGADSAETFQRAFLQVLVDNPTLLPLLNILVTDIRALHKLHFDPGSIFRNNRHE